MNAGSDRGHFRALGTLTLFAISMAYLEATVVVHLQTIFYPGGFTFPLKELPISTYVIELGRETATIIMLATVGRLAGSPGWGRFACFAFLFGVWDIWYYIWLKVFLNWPESLLTWDVLFLIPIVWIGPVLAPILVSILLVCGSIKAIQILNAGGNIQVDRWDWAGASLGTLFILYTFMEDISSVLIQEGADAIMIFVPQAYNWGVFGVGYVLMVGSAVRIIRHSYPN